MADEILTALQLVNEKFNMMDEIAETTYNTAMAAVNRLADLASDLEVINEHISLDETGITINDITNEAPTVDTAALTVTVPPDPSTPELIDDSLNLSDLPSYPSLNISEINPGSNTYSSTLLTALRTKFYDDLSQGSTGIEPAIEDAIWRREEERALQALEDSLDRKASLWAEMGWDLPDGNLTAMIQEEQLTFLNNRLTTSRDVAIKSAELALQNAHFVITQGVSFENMLIQWTNQIAQRVFEASNAVINAQIGKFREDREVVSAERNSIFESAKTRIQYNVGKIQLYATQIEAFNAKLRSEDTRINAVAKATDAKANIYRSTSDWLIGKAGLDIKLIDSRLRQSLGNMELLIKDKEIGLKNQEALNQLRVVALDAIGRLTAQIMAGVWSSVSAGASASTSVGSTYSHGYTERAIVVLGEDETAVVVP